MDLFVVRAKVKFELTIFCLQLEALSTDVQTLADLIRLSRYITKIVSLQCNALDQWKTTIRIDLDV